MNLNLVLLTEGKKNLTRTNAIKLTKPNPGAQSPHSDSQRYNLNSFHEHCLFLCLFSEQTIHKAMHPKPPNSQETHEHSSPRLPDIILSEIGSKGPLQEHLQPGRKGHGWGQESPRSTGRPAFSWFRPKSNPPPTSDDRPSKGGSGGGPWKDKRLAKLQHIWIWETTIFT